MIVVFQLRTLKGPFCRDCGIAAIRTMSAQTLWQGWWGLASLAITLIVLLINLVHRIRFDRVSSPPRASGEPLPNDPGRPLFLRPAILGLLVPLALVCAIAAR